MCMAYEARCSCGAKKASFQFRDNVMSHEVIRALYCPACSPGFAVDTGAMVIDNGWVIEYDMEMAQFMGLKCGHIVTTADDIFDEGYCTWNGMYPGDHIDSLKEREQITALAKASPALYLKEMKSWMTERMKKLQEAGWRKAREKAPAQG